jgi:hypothetical protein
MAYNPYPSRFGADYRNLKIVKKVLSELKSGYICPRVKNKKLHYEQS